MYIVFDIVFDTVQYDFGTAGGKKTKQNLFFLLNSGLLKLLFEFLKINSIIIKIFLGIKKIYFNLCSKL